jgi:hypothetical protein
VRVLLTHPFCNSIEEYLFVYPFPGNVPVILLVDDSLHLLVGRYLLG